MWTEINISKYKRKYFVYLKCMYFQFCFSCRDVPVYNIDTAQSPKRFITKNSYRKNVSIDSEKMNVNL